MRSVVTLNPRPMVGRILCCWLRKKPDRGQAVRAGVIAEPLCGLPDMICRS